MKTYFDQLLKQDLSSYEVKAVNMFLNLTPVNKSTYSDVMTKINHLVSNNSGTYELLYANKPADKTLDAWMQGYGIQKDGHTFLAMIYWEKGEKPLKKFKYDQLDEFEKKLFDARKYIIEIKKQIKEHAEKFKALIITKEALKEAKSKITPFQKIFPNALPVDSIEAVLIDQTKILKEDYLVETKVWADASFAKIVKFASLTNDELRSKYPAKKQYDSTRISIDHKILDKHQKAKEVVRIGFESYLKDELYLAELHYFGSIQKLARRLNQKGIIESKDFTIKTTKIKQNIETLIVDKNGKITKAWTIIASGEIQQPHFRYLVK